MPRLQGRPGTAAWDSGNVMLEAEEHERPSESLPGMVRTKPARLEPVASVWVPHLITLLLYLGYVFLGAVFYMHVEDFEPCDDVNATSCHFEPCDDVNATSCPWSLLDSVYFAHVTMSTVGYGDLSPATRGGQVFTLLYIFFGVAVVFSRLADLLTGFTQPIFNFTRTMLERKFPQAAIDIDGDGVADFKIPRHPLIYFGKALAGPITLIFALQCGWAAIFCAVQDDWSYWIAFYHCIVTATTVGYGDTSITTDAGKVVAIFHIIFSVASISALINDVVDLHHQRSSLLRRAELLSAKLDPQLITTLDNDGSGVDKFEFVVGMLIKLEIVSWEDVIPFVTQFHALDSDNSGHLTTDDLATLAKQVNDKARDAAGKIGTTELAAISKVAAKKRREKADGRTADPVRSSLARGRMSTAGSASGNLDSEVSGAPTPLGRSPTVSTSRTHGEAARADSCSLHAPPCGTCRMCWRRSAPGLSPFGCGGKGVSARSHTPSLFPFPLCHAGRNRSRSRWTRCASQDRCVRSPVGGRPAGVPRAPTHRLQRARATRCRRWAHHPIQTPSASAELAPLYEYVNFHEC